MRKFSYVMLVAFAMLASNAFAANVAKIGDTEYDSFEEAFNALKSGETLKLIADATVSNELIKGTGGNIATSGTYTIDLGGYTLTAQPGLASKGGYDCVMNFYNVNAIVKNGTISDENNSLGTTLGFVDNAKGLVQDVTINYKPVGTSVWGGILADMDADGSSPELVLNNVTMNAVNGYGAQLCVGKFSLINCTFSYSGQSKKSYGNTAVAATSGAQIEINGGSYTSNGTDYGYCLYVLNSGGEFIVNDGTFRGSTSAIRIDNNGSSTDYKGHDNYAGGSVMEVNGGSFYGAIQNAATTNPLSGYAIHGGHFNVDPAKYVDTVNYKITTPQVDEWVVEKKVETTITINDNTGKNEDKAFKLTAENTELTNKVTEAKYVEVAGTESAPAKLTIKTGQTLNVGDDGLNIRPNAQVVVEAGAVLTVGSYGVITSNEESIVIESNGSTTGSYLIDPTTSYNTQPQATIKMVANIGQRGEEDFKWHRFSLPVKNLTAAWSKAPNFGTYLYEWNYGEYGWKLLAGGSTSMRPFAGYTITTKEEIQDVTYTYKGQLLGNADSNIDFTHLGFGYYGNSYTGYIYTKELLGQALEVDGAEGTVWSWNAAGQCFAYASKVEFEEEFDDIPACIKEIAPMQTFILKRNNTGSDMLDIDYAASIWGNPRYGLVEPTAAPARQTTAKTENAAKFVVKIATATCYDQVKMVENEERSDYFENGYDVTKLENPAPTFNLYAVVNDTNYSNVYSNTLNGKKITLAAREETAYTLSIEGTVVGTKYAIRDLSNGEIITIEKDNTYEFTATANTTVERFEIFDNSTSLKEVRSKANAVKMMVDGQMVIVREGQMFNAQGARL